MILVFYIWKARCSAHCSDKNPEYMRLVQTIACCIQFTGCSRPKSGVIPLQLEWTDWSWRPSSSSRPSQRSRADNWRLCRGTPGRGSGHSKDARACLGYVMSRVSRMQRVLGECKHNSLQKGPPRLRLGVSEPRKHHSHQWYSTFAEHCCQCDAECCEQRRAT